MLGPKSKGNRKLPIISTTNFHYRIFTTATRLLLSPYYCIRAFKPRAIKNPIEGVYWWLRTIEV
jgi:hypothetical protein